MNYPLISEYIEAIRYAEDNFATLTNLRPELDDNGNPIMSSGNFAVVFKMKDIKTGNLYAVKCFTREQEGRSDAYERICEHLSKVESDYLVDMEYYQEELFVDSSQTEETEFSILLMDWVEGNTLDKYIDKYKGNSFELYELAYNFRKLAEWFISQDFAHGDIKPDNIIIDSGGNIVLIDYDGMFVPEMEGECFREYGSPNFRHPFINRTYDSHIDDFSLSSICLALKLISISFGLTTRYSLKDGLLFSEEDYININNSPIFSEIRSLISSEKILGLYYATFIKAYSGNTLSESDFCFKEEKDIENLLAFWPSHVHLSHDEMIDRGNQTADGVVYSKDGGMVIGFVNKDYNSEDVYIKEGTIAICENAFAAHYGKKIKLHLPSSLRYFSSKSLNYKYETLSWDSPWFTYSDGYIFTKDKTECVLKHLKDASYDSSTTILGSYVFSNLTFEGEWPNRITKIRHGAFFNSNVPYKLVIPEGVSFIGHGSFLSCSAIEVYFPSSLKRLAEWAFQRCDNLVSVSFNPNCRVRKIESNTFCNCKNLKKINFPQSLECIGNSAFQWCGELETIVFPKKLKIIESEAFNMGDLFDLPGDKLSSFRTLTFPPTLLRIGRDSFSNCCELNTIEIQGEDVVIENGAFANCVNLRELVYKKIKRIENRAFVGCKNLHLEITDEIKYIEEGSITGVKIVNKSTEYEILNNSLISKSNKQLLYYWGTERVFCVPEGVRTLVADSFLNKPQSIILPQSYDESKIQSACFCNHLVVPRHFCIDTNHFSTNQTILSYDKVFIDEYGVIYSENKQELIKYSMNIDNAEYHVLEECKVIRKKAFEHDCGCDGQSLWPLGNNIKNLYLPEGLLYIEESGLLGCIELEELRIPDSVVCLGKEALPCESLRKINIPSQLKELTNNSIPKSVCSISGGSNYYIVKENYICTNDGKLIWISPTINNFVVNDDVKVIVKDSIPQSVETLELNSTDVFIEEGAIPFTIKQITGFSNNYIIHTNYLASKDGVLLWVSPTEEIFDIPKGIVRIGDYAFYHRGNLNSILIPKSIKSIGKSAFHHCCKIKYICIYADLDEISGDALKSCRCWTGNFKYGYQIPVYPERIYVTQGNKMKIKELLGSEAKDKIFVLEDCEFSSPLAIF